MVDGSSVIASSRTESKPDVLEQLVTSLQNETDPFGVEQP
jgi:hypothetical protein